MLSTIPTETSRSASELAAGLTDIALEVLRGAGVGGDSVALELELWRALTAELEREAHRRRTRPLAAASPLDSALAQAVHRAALDVAVAFATDAGPAELDGRIRPWVGRLRFALGLHRQAGRTFAPDEDRPGRPLGSSGVFRKLRVTALN